MTSVLVVSDFTFSSTEIDGLDEAVEMCAFDRADLEEHGGRFWAASLLEPELPVAHVADTGGFLLRPLSGWGPWQQGGEDRRCAVPPRELHRQLGWPAPKIVSNDLFIEVRYSLPPSLIQHFDFDDLRDGLFRVFVIPLPDGEAARLRAHHLAEAGREASC